jgi:hypothetical protein
MSTALQTITKREIVLDLASSKDIDDEGKFIVIPPQKEGRLDAVHFSDGKAIRRTIGETNQQFPRTIIQMIEKGQDVPKYKLGDPNYTVLPKA